MFNHVKLDKVVPRLQQINENGIRHYMTPEGNKYPSITTVLSEYSRKGIYEWRQRVGDEAANRISGKASTRGTKLHKACEDYINNYCRELNIKYPSNNTTWEIGYIRGFGGFGKKKPYYIINDSSIGLPPIHNNDQPISDAAARYLFIDSIPGDIINPQGLFNRNFVFKDFGMKVTSHYIA